MEPAGAVGKGCSYLAAQLLVYRVSPQRRVPDF